MKFVFALLLLAACDRAPSILQQADEPTGIRADCALNGSAAFAECTVQRISHGDETTLTLIAPDGGFRRLAVAADGTGISAADGAEAARVSSGPDGKIEVVIAADRYRLPAAKP